MEYRYDIFADNSHTVQFLHSYKKGRLHGAVTLKSFHKGSRFETHIVFVEGILDSVMELVIENDEITYETRSIRDLDLPANKAASMNELDKTINNHLKYLGRDVRHTYGKLEKYQIQAQFPCRDLWLPEW